MDSIIQDSRKLQDQLGEISGKLGISRKAPARKDLPLFIQYLLDEGVITDESLKPFYKIKMTPRDMEPYLLPHVGKETLLRALSYDFQVRAIDLEKADISPQVAKAIPRDVGELYGVCCIAIDEQGMKIAMVEPQNTHVLEQVEAKTDFKVVECFVVLYADLAEFQKLLYEGIRHLPINARDIVDDIIKKALGQKTSDIHIEPMEDDIKVRFRKDGVLTETYDIKEDILKGYSYRKLIVEHLKGAIPVVVKNKSGASGSVIDIAETQKPQDGRISLPSRNMDMRVSILPTVNGSSIVIRILSPEKEKPDFTRLGFSSGDSERFRNIINAPYGLVLVSGPTGSGKTTTLYTVLKYLHNPEKKILTVEDPVEYTMPGIMQVKVNPMKDVTFAAALRSFLRHDPDIIMVGEIRDRETASMAVEASLTGHMVLSTIHANDAVRTITRIKDLGVNPLLLTSTCLATMAQRLVRINCPHCRERASFSPRFFRLMDYYKVPWHKERLVQSKGCPACNHTGYQGRRGIYELLVLSQEIQSMILNNVPDIDIEKTARAQGMRLLIEDALLKTAAGLTTEEEVLRVTLTDYLDDMDRKLEGFSEVPETPFLNEYDDISSFNPPGMLEELPDEPSVEPHGRSAVELTHPLPTLDVPPAPADTPADASADAEVQIPYVNGRHKPLLEKPVIDTIQAPPDRPQEPVVNLRLPVMKDVQPPVTESPRITGNTASPELPKRPQIQAPQEPEKKSPVVVKGPSATFSTLPDAGKKEKAPSHTGETTIVPPSHLPPAPHRAEGMQKAPVTSNVPDLALPDSIEVPDNSLPDWTGEDVKACTPPTPEPAEKVEWELQVFWEGEWCKL